MSNTTNPPPIPEGFMKAQGAAAAEYKEQCKVDRDRGHLADCDFSEGAQWAYRHLSPTGESAGRWVSDKLPSQKGMYYCRVKVDGDLRQDIVEFDGAHWGELERYGTYDDLHLLSWLDESPSQPSAGMEWISVKDRFPDGMDPCWTVIMFEDADQYITENHFLPSLKEWNNDRKYVTHWMYKTFPPLPPIPPNQPRDSNTVT